MGYMIAVLYRAIQGHNDNDDTLL